jgi:hypothetical protein
VIVNPRGTSGSGKTELVRRIAADYGWGESGRVELVHREGRVRPIAYRLRHPLGGRPLAVLGHYEATSGGCDTIRAADGGMDEAFRLAGGYAADGHDVLLEGLLLSGEHVRSAALAREHGLHVLRLSTPLDRCIRNVIARQRAGRRGRASAARTATTQQADVEEACRRLRRHASVEVPRLRRRAPPRAGAARAWPACGGGRSYPARSPNHSSRRGKCLRDARNGAKGLLRVRTA